MVRLVRRCAAVLALVILASGPATGLALAQGERPDLKIEVVGLDPSNPRAVKVRVTNVGQWWADRTSATVEAVPAAAGAKATEQVPDLGPKGDPETASQYEFTYTLAAPCGGRQVEVRAVLKAATTFNGNTEANTANNAHAREVCAAAQPFDPSAQGIKDQVPGAVEHLPFDPAGRGIVVRDQVPGAGEVLLGGEHRWPGEHTLPFEPSPARSATRVTTTGDPLVNAPPGLAVGWSQNEYAFGKSVVVVAQTAVKFDLAMLEEIPRDKRVVGKALLTFDEHAFQWTDGEGREQFKPGCVAVLGIATADWAGQPVNALFPNEYYNDAPGGSARQWDVTGHVQRQLAFADDPSLRHGYVLRGGLEELNADDDTSCMSTLSNIRLLITYVVPSN